MEPKETTSERKAPVGLGTRIFKLIYKIDTQAFALIITLLLAFQVFFGILYNTEMIPLYFGKTVIVRFLGYLGLVNALIDFYRQAFFHRGKAFSQTFLKRPWTGLFVLLLLWSFFTIAVAKDKTLAIFGGPYRYEGYLSYLAYAGIFANAAIIRTEKARKTLFVTVAVSSSLLAALTLIKELFGVSFLMDRSGHVVDYSATFSNSNHYGYYLCVSMMVIVGLFMTSDKLWKKITYGCFFTINLIVMLLNGSLGPYLAIAVGMLLYLAFYWIRKGFGKTWQLFILIAEFILLSFLINGSKMIDDLNLVARQTGNVIDVYNSGAVDTPEGQKVIDEIGSSRGVLWKDTIGIIFKYPFMGVGTDNIQLYLDNNMPHNEYLQIAANQGVFGAILYLAALISCFVYSVVNLKKLSDGALIAGMAVAVYCVSAFFGLTITITAYQLFLFFGLLTGWFKNRDEIVMNERLLSVLSTKSEEPETSLKVSE